MFCLHLCRGGGGILLVIAVVASALAKKVEAKCCKTNTLPPLGCFLWRHFTYNHLYCLRFYKGSGGILLIFADIASTFENDDHVHGL